MILSASVGSSADLSTEEVRQLREEALRFAAVAATLAVDDLAKNPSYAAAAHRAAVKALADRRDWAVARLADANDPAAEEAAALVRNYRAALLANPLLDADRILCVRRLLDNPVWPRANKPGGSDFPYSKRAFSRRLGLLGLNAHNHMDLRRAGFTNDIAVISNLRGSPAITSLYRPPNTAIVRDLDLDFDASRILFTSYRGTNNLLGVYEIEIKSPPSAALSDASQLSGPSGLSKLSRDATLSAEGALNHLKGEARLNLQAKLVSPEDGHYDIQGWDACYLPNRG